MLKDHFLKEINLQNVLKVGSTGSEVQKVQEWLNLWRDVDTTWSYQVDMDGQFGEQTKKVVQLFQEKYGLNADGMVGTKTFHQLVKPMIRAFSRIDGQGSLRELVVAYAEQHLANKPNELLKQNRGPWVRAYMDGNEGTQWAWCMGFVQTILDQAFTTLERTFTSVVPSTYSCDNVGEHGLKAQKLIPFESARTNPAQIEAGDIFLVKSKPHDWTHTGLIVRVEGNILHTIEGNSNDEGSREGHEVCKRIRHLQTEKLDIFRLG